MIHYREGYLYQLSRPCSFSTGIIPPRPIDQEYYALNMKGMLTIEAGYAWDGATWCPEWLVPPEDSCVHDALCQAMRHGHLDYDMFAPQAHGLLRDTVAKRRGGFLAGIVHKAVVLARGGHPSNSDDNPELTDP